MAYNTRSRQAPKKDEVESTTANKGEVESVPEVTKVRKGRSSKAKDDASFSEVKEKAKKDKAEESFAEATDAKPKRGRKLVKDKSISASAMPTKRVTRSSSVLNEVAEQALNESNATQTNNSNEIIESFVEKGAEDNNKIIQSIESNKSSNLSNAQGSELSALNATNEVEQTQVVNEDTMVSNAVEKNTQVVQTVESMEFYSCEENLESRQQSDLNKVGIIKEQVQVNKDDLIKKNKVIDIEVKGTEIVEESIKDAVNEEVANNDSTIENNIEEEQEDSELDEGTDKIIQQLLEAEGNKKDTLNDEEIVQEDIIEENLHDDSEESNYFSFSDENEDDIDDDYLNNLLAKAKQNLSNPTENNNNKEFNPNKAFSNPYDEKIKHNLYIQTGNKSKDRKHGFRPAAIQTEIVQTKEIIPGMSNKRKNLEQVEDIDNDTFISEEVANALEVSSRKGLDQLNINRSLDGPRITRKDKIKEKESTTGKKWFDMPAPIITDELKRDLQVLKLRKVLDRKRFYKKDNKGLQSKYFQVGTIIEDKSEFYSARLNNKDRKQNIVQELLHDGQAQEYFKDRFLQHQQTSIANSRRPTKLKKFKNKK